MRHLVSAAMAAGVALGIAAAPVVAHAETARKLRHAVAPPPAAFPPMEDPRIPHPSPDMSGGNAAAGGNNANSMSGSNSAGENANGRSSGGFGG